VKFALMTAMVTAATYATNYWPTATSWVQPRDARPEAVLTGAVLLMLASLLSRNLATGRSRR
jgi:hypothetical protein